MFRFIANRITWGIDAVVFWLIPFEVYEAIVGKRYEVTEKLVHILELFPTLEYILPHHLKLLVYCLRDKIQCAMGMVNWNLLIVWFLASLVAIWTAASCWITSSRLLLLLSTRGLASRIWCLTSLSRLLSLYLTVISTLLFFPFLFLLSF